MLIRKLIGEERLKSAFFVSRAGHWKETHGVETLMLAIQEENVPIMEEDVIFYFISFQFYQG